RLLMTARTRIRSAKSTRLFRSYKRPRPKYKHVAMRTASIIDELVRHVLGLIGVGISELARAHLISPVHGIYGDGRVHIVGGILNDGQRLLFDVIGDRYEVIRLYIEELARGRIYVKETLLIERDKRYAVG